jgi:hypothetical protein
MPRQSDDEESQLPSDSDYVTLPTDRRKCGAGRVAFSGEGSISVLSPVKEIIYEKQGRAQEQRALCAAHVTVTAIGYCPALRYPFGVVSSHSIPSPVEQIQAPQNIQNMQSSLLMSKKNAKNKDMKSLGNLNRVYPQRVDPI